MTKDEFVRYIDYAVLKPESTDDFIINECKFALDANVINFCVHSNKVSLIKPLLEGSTTLLGAVAGFPTGAHTPYIKGLEAEEAADHGAQEIDMVMNIGALKSRNHALVKEDIETVVRASGVLVKVILETAYLTEEEIIMACRISEDAGASYVKSSTGFAHEGAKLEKLNIMKKAVSDKMKLKASGGISDLKTALTFIESGCSRIGTSRLSSILKEFD
ncbi:deoxyribose-phosphate aldolase [Alkalibacter sp. M17DMB]|nr:deoxyribose-phosphate aldolase [Alkalibacter mobilis]